ncbi:MAG: Type IV secretory pathway VirB4 protein [Candidatus Peregrinibacteria bacterium GW2011_GWF2_38_29]|nr:MAG: Type IV secretory pathway VirB4 protein [Candidatus Peregrinibacteria bacterium GW2011_GWF2_38_29]KKR05295.1 MAG: Type IV secretory pathway VirB4 protein [Candidatus Peregrinibacteria bacterium GW2011_GWC2_39_14]HBB03031.1 hypothetical protein [Candidatus Peregrinibacteria bacterium]
MPEYEDSVKKRKQGPQMSTQMYMRVSEIHDDTVVLKNGGLRTILKCTALNFNLKSEQEQNALISGYQAFLNTLDFPVQIVVRSKKMDIDQYIEKLKKLSEGQQNPLLRQQTFEYADFIQKLVEYADIMAKEFYVVVPFNPFRAEKANFFDKFLARLRPADSTAEIKKRHSEFEQLKKDLTQRVNVVKSGLENCGVKNDQLSTQELIELFYNTYNPQASRNQKVKDVGQLNLEVN